MDVETLLIPLAGETPCGMSLLHDAVYDAIRFARQNDDASLPQGVWAKPLKKADWAESMRLCTGVLTDRSKDIQIAAWLGEAWISQDGIAGGIRAVALMDGLCERFWQDIHPLPRDNDLDFRIAPINWADGRWAEAVLLRVWLVRGTGVSQGNYTLGDWNDALALQNDIVKNKNALAAAEKSGAPIFARIMESVATMPLSALSDALEGVNIWIEALLGLQLTLEQQMPGDAPRQNKLHNTLQAIEDVLHQCLTQHPKYIAPAEPLIQNDHIDAENNDISNSNEFPMQELNRENAYRKLVDIAHFLSGIEPHSPVPYLIWRAISWGRMPFDELMNELIKNNGEMQKILLRN